MGTSAGGVRRARQLLHVSVLAQSAAPCGRFLAAANDFGEIAVFGLSAALSAEAKEENRRPVTVFKAHSGPVYSLASTERLLLSGSDGEIRAWGWAELGRKEQPGGARDQRAGGEPEGSLGGSGRGRRGRAGSGPGERRLHPRAAGAPGPGPRGGSAGAAAPGPVGGRGRHRAPLGSALGVSGAADRGPQIPGVQPPPAGQVDSLFGHRERLDGVRGRPRPHLVAPALGDPDHGVPAGPAPAPRPLPPGHGALRWGWPRPSPAAAQRGRPRACPGVAPGAAEPLPPPPLT